MSRTSIELVPVTYPSAVAVQPSAKHSSTAQLNKPAPRSSNDSQVRSNEDAAGAETQANVSKSKTAVVITSVTCITGISSLLAGLVTVGLPTIAKDLQLADNLLLWPSSIYALTCACTLLLSGAIADVLGARPMYLAGCFLQSGFTLACGLSRSGTQLILFRAFAGVAISLCLPSAVSIITSSFPPGRRRNIAFASMGGGQPIGFSLGLTLGGVVSESVGWRWGFHSAAILNTLIFVVALWGLPRGESDIADGVSNSAWQRLKVDVDWVGAVIASASLGMMSYVFATLAASAATLRSPATLTLLILSFLLLPLFHIHETRQTRLSRPALIPPALWRTRAFTSLCCAVLLTWGAFNAIETTASLFFQNSLGASPAVASLYFLPAPVAGAAANLATGLLVHKLSRPDRVVALAVLLSSASPLLLALAGKNWTYWAAAFPSMALNPVGADVLFTISNLLITEVFPARTQALAGGVFNTVAQVGKSVGLASSAVVAANVTARSRMGGGGDDADAVLDGYRATFWYCFALTGATFVVSLWGLRGIGMVGIKRE